jgi:inorganic triphosphatase YgiF
MSIALLANVLTIILCMAVLVQSVRMMRSLRTVKDGALTQVVEALQVATVQARAVLSDMKHTLGTDCARHAQLVDRARELRDELSLMTGLADAAAERIVSAVAMANAQRHAREDEAVDAEGEAIAAGGGTVAEAA